MKYATLLAGFLVVASQTGGNLDAARKKFNAGEMKQAAELYLQAVKEEPTSPQVYVELIRTLLELEDLKSAGAASTSAGTALPNSAPVMAAIGDVLYHAGKVTEADQVYRRALELDAKLARAWWGNGRIQKLSGKGKQARQSFIKAYELDPNDPDIVGSWTETLEKPSEIAAGLERKAELTLFRGQQYVGQIRTEAAAKRFLGDRKECELASPAMKTTLELKTGASSTLNLGGLGSIQIPAQAERRFSASVNGKAGEFHFDISSSRTTIYEKSAKKLGVVRVADGPAPGAYVGFVERMTLGKLEFHNCLVNVLGFSNFSLISAIDYDGIIGPDVLSPFILTINPKKGNLILDPLPPLPSGEREHWVDATIGDDRQNFTPLLFGGQWLVTASVGGKPPLLFGLSTGGNVSYVTSQVGQSLKLSKSAPPSINGQCLVNCLPIEIGNRKATTSLKIVELPRNNHGLNIEIAGQLASDYLYQFVVTIDFRNGLLKLDK